MERAQGFVAADNDLIAEIQALDYFNIGDATDASLHRNELNFVAADDENTLNVSLVAGICDVRAGGSKRDGAAGIMIRGEILLRAHGERLDRNAERVLFFCRLDLGGDWTTRPQTCGRMVKRDDHFEIASFLRVRGGLRHRSVAGAAQDGFVADGSDFAGECFVRDGVNGDFRGLAVAHIRDVRLIDFDFGRYNTHIGEREQEAALRILNAWDDVFADA